MAIVNGVGSNALNALLYLSTNAINHVKMEDRQFRLPLMVQARYLVEQVLEDLDIMQIPLVILKRVVQLYLLIIFHQEQL